MKISFEKIQKYQERFMKLDHMEFDTVGDLFTHKELRELIGILGNLLFFMHMTNKEGLEI